MSEHTIKLPAKALNTSNVIVLDANGDQLLEMSISQQGARTKVIQALNGYGEMVETLREILEMGDFGSSSVAEDALKSIGVLDD